MDRLFFGSLCLLSLFGIAGCSTGQIWNQMPLQGPLLAPKKTASDAARPPSQSQSPQLSNVIVQDTQPTSSARSTAPADAAKTVDLDRFVSNLEDEIESPELAKRAAGTTDATHNAPNADDLERAIEALTGDPSAVSPGAFKQGFTEKNIAIEGPGQADGPIGRERKPSLRFATPSTSPQPATDKPAESPATAPLVRFRDAPSDLLPDPPEQLQRTSTRPLLQEGWTAAPE